MSSASDPIDTNANIEDELSVLMSEYMVKKEGEAIHRSANIVRDAASHVGIETPVAVLVGIRSGLEELVRISVAAEQASQRRHEQLCKILLASASRSVTLESRRESTYLGMPPGTPDERSQYYYRDAKISSAHHLVGVCLLQLCGVLDKYEQSKGESEIDTVSMGLKEWTTAVKLTLTCDSQMTSVKGEVSPPKPSTADFATAAGYVSSTIPGRNVSCSVSHIYELCRHSPSVASCMAAVIERLMRCPGIVTAERHVKLSKLRFPYALDEASLNTGEPTSSPLTSVVSGVSRLKHSKKKDYVHRVLNNGQKPSVALYKVESSLQ